MRTMLSILRRTNYSKFEIDVPFLKRKLSTQSYFKIMIAFIERLVAEPLSGTNSLYFQLMQKSEKYLEKSPLRDHFRRLCHFSFYGVFMPALLSDMIITI